MTGTYKVSTNTSSLGSAAKFGAADINRITKTLNGDLDVDTPEINSPFVVRSGKLLQRNPANTFNYIVTNGAITADRIVNEPVLTGTDTRVYQAHTQTLSNKTLDSSCTVDSASLPAAAVTLTGTQTLTNKTITQPIISTISNTGIVTLPTATDTLVGRDTTDTLTNKTLTSPTINTPTLGAPLIVANGGTGAGTLTGVLKGNGTGVVTAAAQLAVADGGTGAATLTGVLKGNGTSAFTAAALLVVADGGTGVGTLTGILKGNGTGAFSAVTAPTGALLGDTDTQSLTNKTLTAPTISDPTLSTTLTTSTAFPNVLLSPNKSSRYAIWWASSSATAPIEGSMTLTQAVTGSGAGSGILCSSTGVKYRGLTGATINSLYGCGQTFVATERDLNPWCEWKFSISVATSVRAFFGMTSGLVAPASSADYLANLSGVGFWVDISVDGNWHISQNSGGASSDRTTVTLAALDTSIHTYSLRADNANSKFQCSIDGAAWTNINTSIPIAGTALTWRWYIETLNTTSKNLDTSYFMYKQDG